MPAGYFSHFLRGALPAFRLNFPALRGCYSTKVPANNFIPNPLHILHLEDNPADAGLVKRRLDADKLTTHITRVETEADFSHALKHLPVDVILADCKLHGYDGFAALRLAREIAPGIPFIFVTGTLDEEMAVSSIHQGATDYVLKRELARLGLSIRRALRESREHLARTRAEEALRASENQYRLLFENNPTPVFVFAAETFEFLAVNEAAIRHYGYAPALFLSLTLKDLALPEEFTLFLDRLTRLATGSGHAGIWRHRQQDGKLSEMELTCHSLIFAGKKAWLALAFNATERLSLEAQLRQSQKMESVGQLAGGIAHDFNNLLTVISGHAGLLLAKESLAPQIADPLKEIYEAAKRAADLTRQLLTFSRKQVLQPQAVDLNEAVNNVGKMLRRVLGEDIALELDFSPSLPCVKADLGMIEQVLLNLAVNSRDAMPRGGRLRINTASEIVDEAHAQKNPEAATGRFVCLSFADNGCGIPPENLPRIFEPFFTTKELDRGTGLGLATVYGIIKQHQGWIEVASELQRGTTFKIFLPASNETSAAATMPAGEQRVIGGTETILVVEDEAPLLRLIHHILESHGYKVLDCANGKSALELWGEHRKKIDLLFTDMVLPDGMTGPELAEILVASKPGLKVIYTSGYDSEKLGAGPSLREGFNFIKKPFHARKLAETVYDCLLKK